MNTDNILHSDSQEAIPMQEFSQPIAPQGRRQFLHAMAATSAGVGALMLASAPAGAAVGTKTGTTITGIYDVTDTKYGAKGDGFADDTAAINKAIAAAVATNGFKDASGNLSPGGGIVWFPSGTYKITSPITIPQQVTLMGSGWGAPWQGQGGSMILVANTTALLNAPAITIPQPNIPANPNHSSGSTGTTIRDLAILHTRVDPASVSGTWQPEPYAEAISIQADGVRIVNVLLVNPTVGITVTNAGRVTIDGLFGQPLIAGVKMDGIQDVITINNVHFWQFWENTDLVNNWTNNNAIAFISGRNDNPQFTKIFAQNYRIGFYFTQPWTNALNNSPNVGQTNFFKMSDVDFGGGKRGIWIDQSWVTGQVSNLTCSGGIFVHTDNIRLQMNNIFMGAPASVNLNDTSTGVLLFIQGNVAPVSGGTNLNIITINGLWCQDWNNTGQGFPGAINTSAVEAHELSLINIGQGRIFTMTNGQGYTFPVTTSSATVSFASAWGGGTVNLN